MISIGFTSTEYSDFLFVLEGGCLELWIVSLRAPENLAIPLIAEKGE